MKVYFKLSLLVFAFLSLSACFSFGGGEEVYETLENPHLYVIDVDRGQVAEAFASGRAVYLKPVKVTPHFRTKQLVYKVAENEFRPLPSHQFFSTPEQMFTEQVRRWLQKSGLFSQVVTTPTEEVDYTLEVAVTGLYADNRREFSPMAILEMQFFMTFSGTESEKVAFQVGLAADVDIEEVTPTNSVKGWKQGLKELLTTLELDLSAYFSKIDTH